jgi:hypothetical protein
VRGVGSIEERLLAALDGERIRERLEQLRHGAGASAAFAVWCGGRERYYGSGDAASDAAEQPIATGCITKLFTAALVCEAADRAALDLDADVRPLLGLDAPALAGVTLRLLLEHSHGLDDSLLTRAPRTEAGRIDAAQLVTLLAAQPPLAAPGEIYSYSNAGAWLAAALLERSSGRLYADLLHERLLPGTTASAACPATGGPLSVRARQLLGFLRRNAERRAQWPLAQDGGMPMPGWSPLERGAHLGWKAHGAGVFGHQSVLPGASALVRVAPAARAAVLVASAALPAAMLTAKLLGADLSELVGLQPRPAAANAPADLGAYAGRYRCAARSLIVGVARDALTLRVEQGLGHSAVRLTLRPAGEHAFVPEHAARCAGLSFVQFVRPCGGAFRFLWNGRTVLRRA